MTNHEEKVRTVISKVLKVDRQSIDFDDDLVKKFNMDSMQRVEIVIELENQFDITISDDSAVLLRSLSQILEFLNQVTTQK